MIKKKGGRMLGKGVYILAEVSQLTKMHSGRVRSWFKYSTNPHHKPIFESDYQSVKGDYAVSFLDLIDVYVVSQFRDFHGISMQTIRRAYKILQKKLNTKHPFCHRDLYTDGKRIFDLAASELSDIKEGRILTEVLSQQQFFTYIIKKLSHIDYDAVSKIAERWKISQGIIIDPNVNMGKPIIENTGIASFVVANQYWANKKDTALVADLYDINERDVLNAVKFEEWYKLRHAA